jgi:hypothetical protein
MQGTRQKTKDWHNKEVVYYTRARIETLVTTIIIIMILGLLVLPVYLLYHLVSLSNANGTNPTCIGVLLVATLLFSATLALFTRAQRHEILAAAAAYCAILVVFLGNIPQVRGG